MYKVQVLHKLNGSHKIYSFLSDKKVRNGRKVVCDSTLGEVHGFVLSTRELSDVDNISSKVISVLPNNSFNIHKYIRKMARKQRLTISDNALTMYANTVRGNDNIDPELALKKLTRNIVLAAKAGGNRYRSTIDFRYGALNITVEVESLEIVAVSNKKRIKDDWVKDVELYNILNEEFGIPKE